MKLTFKDQFQSSLVVTLKGQLCVFKVGVKVAPTDRGHDLGVPQGFYRSEENYVKSSSNNATDQI